MTETKTEYIKYPRTYHLAFSEKTTHDDRVLEDHTCFEGREVIVTEKMDGENTTLYHNYLHARSINETQHPSRNWLKNFHSKIKADIPEGWRICGENMYAKHTVFYDDLESYYYVFSIWNENNVCLSWSDTLMWAELLGLTLASVLYSGVWDEEKVKEICQDMTREGIVVRVADSFPFEQFRDKVAKYVTPAFRKALKKGSSHWRYKPITKNQLRKDDDE